MHQVLESEHQAAESSQPAIAVEQLDHFFGTGELRKQVLFDINLAIAAGEIIILTGPSGSGENNPAVANGWAAIAPKQAVCVSWGLNWSAQPKTSQSKHVASVATSSRRTICTAVSLLKQT